MTPLTDPRQPGSNGRTAKPSKHEPFMAEYLTMFLRGKQTILYCLILVTAVVAVYTFFKSPVYESSALVLIDMKGTNGSLPVSLDISGAATLNKITNELEILKSGTMAEAAAEKLLAKKTLPTDNRIPIPIIQTRGENDSLITCSPEELMERLDRVIEFTPVRESDMIKISARSTNPREAALLANVYAEAYVERNLAASRTRSGALREFLQTQGESKKQALDTIETSLQAYMRSSGTVSLDDETKTLVEQLAQLEAGRDAIRVDLSSKEKTLTAYKEELARQEPAVARSIGESNNSYVRLLQDELAKLEVQRDVFIAQNPQLAGQKLYLDKLSEIDKQIVSLKEKLQGRTSEYMKSLVPSLPGEGSAGYLAQTKQKIIEQQIELGGLSARERALSRVIADYEQQFNRIPQKSIDLARLQRARLSTEKLYLLIEEKYNQAAITEKSEFGYVDIVDPGRVPAKPVSPKVALNLILGVLSGLGLGVIMVIVRERLNVRMRTPEDLKRFGFRTVSTISRMVGAGGNPRDPSITPAGGAASPRLNSVNGLLSTAARSARDLRTHLVRTVKEKLNPRDGAGKPGDAEPFDPHLISFLGPRSTFAESYRNLRTNVQFAKNGEPLKSIMVTSANPSEGKSTTAANLAIAFAQVERRVLLVDADMYRPVLHEFFKIRMTPGLSDYILGKATYDEVVQRNVLDNLDIICSGTMPPNSVEIPSSEKMKVLFRQALQSYNVMLLDSPPVLAATDASVLATQVDGTLLVVSYDNTRELEIERTMESLESVGARILGVVLNNFDARKAYGGYAPASHYGYGYGQYGITSTSGNAQGKQKSREI
jgi:capsular exopolysaccharide synthesis family protein